SLLVLDSFKEHLTNSVKQQFFEHNTNLAVILRRLMLKLQPFNIAINKSFKTKL
ncbi:12525_t:CDS:1, partial [Racocetra persica]